MLKPLLIGLPCLALASSCLSAAEPSAFEQANQHFAAGDFAAAAESYEAAIASDGPRAATFFNLGNAYQKLGKHGPAILAYERTRLLTPRDPDLLANLALARKAAAAFEEPRLGPRLDAALTRFSRNEWSWLVAASALYLGALSVLRGATRLPRAGMRRAARISAALAVLIIAAGAAVLHLRRDEASRAIVLSENATVRLSPFPEAESLGTPGQGKTVILKDATPGFRFVEVPGTPLKGWISENDVAAIIPEPHPD